MAKDGPKMASTWPQMAILGLPLANTWGSFGAILGNLGVKVHVSARLDLLVPFWGHPLRTLILSKYSVDRSVRSCAVCENAPAAQHNWTRVSRMLLLTSFRLLSSLSTGCPSVFRVNGAADVADLLLLSAATPPFWPCAARD